jgi:hypothetical protein
MWHGFFVAVITAYAAINHFLSGPLVGWLNLLTIPLMIIVVVFVMERMRI